MYKSESNVEEKMREDDDVDVNSATVAAGIDDGDAA